MDDPSCFREEAIREECKKKKKNEFLPFFVRETVAEEGRHSWRALKTTSDAHTKAAKEN